MQTFKPNDRQALSIPRQKRDLIEFAARTDITIVDQLIERQSAKDTGRPVFNEILRRIEAGEAAGILAWAPDRLRAHAPPATGWAHALHLRQVHAPRAMRQTSGNSQQDREHEIDGLLATIHV